MSASAIPGEQVLGTILHAARNPDYAIEAVVFTDRRVLGVSTPKLGHAAAAAGLVGVLATGVNGMGGLLGLRAWGKYKQAVAGQPGVSLDRSPVPPEVLAAVSREIPYEKVKAVSVKKIWGSADTLLDVAAGFLGTGRWATSLSGDEVRSFVAQTPLAPKLAP